MGRCRWMGVLLMVATGWCSAQTFWTESRINEVFEILYAQGAVAAVVEVESAGMTAYDFGITLLERNRKEDALAWFNNLIGGSPAGAVREKYLFGKAWIQMDSGNFRDAMMTANELKQASLDPLVQARSFYLLAVIYKQSGSTEFVDPLLDQAERLYTMLNKQGGVILCQNLRMTSNKHFGPTAPAPNDESGIFLLSVIKGRLPFSANQIRYQIRHHPNSREVMGAWCDGDTYVIDMAVFSVWVKDFIRQKNKNPLGSANFRPKEASS